MQLTFAKYSPTLLAMRPTVPVQTALGNYIRELREQAGLTLEQLAEKSGFSTNRLEAIERGEVNLNLGAMLILAMSLDTSPQDLFSGIARRISGSPKLLCARVIAFPKYGGIKN